MKYTAGFLSGLLVASLIWGVAALNWSPAIIIGIIILCAFMLIAIVIEFLEHWE